MKSKARVAVMTGNQNALKAQKSNAVFYMRCTAQQKAKLLALAEAQGLQPAAYVIEQLGLDDDAN